MRKNIVIVILLLAVIGCAGYIGYDKLYLKKQTSQEQEEKLPEKSSKKEIKADSTFAEELIGRYDYYFIDDANLENILYKSEKTTAAELTENFIKQTAAYAYYAIPRGLSSKWQQTYSFTSDELKQQIRKLYGPDVTITDGGFEMDCGTYEYNTENNTYTRNEGSSCGGTSSSYLERKIISATEEGNTINIEVAVARIDRGTNQILNMNDEAIEGLTTENFNINNVIEQLDQFAYHFLFDEDNNNYYLDSITKMK